MNINNNMCINEKIKEMHDIEIRIGINCLGL